MGSHLYNQDQPQGNGCWTQILIATVLILILLAGIEIGLSLGRFLLVPARPAATEGR